MDYYSRFNEQALMDSLENFPVTAVTGPRQCGKSTLVKMFVKEYMEGNRSQTFVCGYSRCERLAIEARY